MSWKMEAKGQTSELCCQMIVLKPIILLAKAGQPGRCQPGILDIYTVCGTTAQVRPIFLAYRESCASNIPERFIML
jgi:hypothetical protein